MPNDNLAPQAKKVLHRAREFLAAPSPDSTSKSKLSGELAEIKNLLQLDLTERKKYPSELETNCQQEIESHRLRFDENEVAQRHLAKQRAIETRFEQLRQLNNGSYPRNVNPILYWIPLFLVAVSEWYVNYSSFAARFVPAVAIACTIIVGLLFAYTSHILGAYLKQWAEISDPAIETRRVFDRKIAVIALTIVLFIVFVATMWLRYTIIKDQLGINSQEANCEFCTETSGRIWSTLLPTIAINIGIITIGTVYSWFMHERVPDLRETSQQLEASHRKWDRLQKPFVTEKKRLLAACERDKKTNQTIVKDYSGLLTAITEIQGRLNAGNK